MSQKMVVRLTLAFLCKYNNVHILDSWNYKFRNEDFECFIHPTKIKKIRISANLNLVLNEKMDVYNAICIISRHTN